MGEMRSIRTNGAIRRSVNKNSDGKAARYLSASVSGDRHRFRRKACGGAAARRTVADNKKPRVVSSAFLVGTTGLVRSTKCDGIAGSRHLICVRSSRRTADRVSSDEVTGSAVRRAAAPPHGGLLRTAKSRGDKPRLFWWSKRQKIEQSH